jgi:predicted peroxiredoxin
MSEQTETRETGVTRQDFLKGLGAGLGAVGLAALAGSSSALAAEEKSDRSIVVITNGGSDPNRAILGLLCAVTALDKGFGAVHVWLTLDGADLANKTKVARIESPIFKKFGNAEELMKKLKEKGASFGVCPPCAEYMGAVGGDKVDFVEKQGADWLMKNIKGASVAWM